MTGHGLLCACVTCSADEERAYNAWLDEQEGKAIARAAEFDTCD